MIKLPISPYETRQEEYREDQWKMLMVCMMLNQTSWKQVDKVRHEFFDRWPTADAFLTSIDEDVINLIRPLGFYNKRNQSWREFCQQWIQLTDGVEDLRTIPVEEISKLRGVGKYALDSWKVFQLYQYNIPVEDHVLNWYVEWAKEQVEELELSQLEFKPIVIYYFHYKDEELREPAWSQKQDYVACVMARNVKEAQRKVKAMLPGSHLKWMGVANGKPEWVDEEMPLGTREIMPHGGWKNRP